MKIALKETLKCKVGLMLLMMYMISYAGYSILEAKSTNIVSMAVADYQNLNEYLLPFGLVSVILIVLSFTISLSNKYAIDYIFTSMNNRFNEKVLRAKYQMFTEISCATIQTTAEGIHSLSIACYHVCSAVVQIVKVVVNLVAIWLIAGNVVIPVIAAYAIFVVCVKKLFWIYDEMNMAVNKIRKARNQQMDEVIHGFAEVRSMNMQNFHHDSLRKQNDSLIHQRRKFGIVNASLGGMIDGISMVGVYLIMFYVAALLINNEIAPSAAMALVLYINRIANPMVQMLSLIDNLSDDTRTAKDFQRIMDYDLYSDGDIELKSFDNDINIKNVSFAYNDSDTVLKDINLKIKKGSKVGICGSSGGGKSTILKLLMGFYDDYAGDIEIDGVDIRDLEIDSLRKRIGIVHQDSMIFNKTIKENIAYGNPNATEMEIIEATRLAGLYDFIQSLPEKFDTKVGDRGLKLSGGQKQRISIARIFLKNPEIILLDEATSALDNESECIIQESLKLFGDKTVITVAHRLSTIKDSDQIAVIENHEISECGSHDDLMAKNGRYAELVRISQKNAK